MSNVPNRETFESIYAGKAPWDIGKPQPAFVEVADRVTGGPRCGLRHRRERTVLRRAGAFGAEDENEIKWRKDFMRQIGYKQ